VPSSSAVEASDAGSSLRPRLVWVTAFRTAAATLLLAVYGVRLLSRPSAEALGGEDLLSLWMVGCIYLLVLVQALFLRNSKPGARSALVHVAGDVAIATVLVFLTGGPESPFTFTYLLVVVGASILLGQWGALAAAAACSVSFLVLAAAVSSGTIRTPVPLGTLSVGRLAFLCASNVLAQFLTAVLTGFLARQLTTAGGRLSARERDLRELTRLQQQILSAMPSGLLTCDVEGRITYVNRAARQILGLDAAGTPASVEELIPGVRTLFTGKPRSEVTVTTPAGRRILGLTVSALGVPPAPLLVVFQDLTDLRRAEQELRRADRMAELGALSAQLAHEIRNPLAAMRGSAQLLSPGADPDTERLVGILTREADRLGDLVSDFLAFARPPTPVLRPCDLDELVRQTIELLSSDPLASGVEIEVERGGLRAEVDPDQMRQVLLNLLRNALAAAGKGGRVRTFFSRVDGQVRIHVWDSGGSIATADLPRIFEPFFTKRTGGTGLGLSTVHSIVRAHGGQIEVSSSPGEGTEFVVGFAAPEGEVSRA
jgi:two-component system sensor histidine kinase PilS (NtrC family)